jgi:eukaryotic-like serine/threonine-protein kinase
VSAATDVYALGVLLFALLTHRHPAGEDRSAADLVTQVVHNEPPRASAVVADEKLRRALRGDLDTILAKALKKHPSDRYVSAAAGSNSHASNGFQGATVAGDAAGAVAHCPLLPRA